MSSLADWRAAVDVAALSLAGWLQEQDLMGEAERALTLALRERLSSDKLQVAFVAEFSRGKSELINAIFFADAGRRVLPATPGRTTMCPVELGFDANLPPSLALLPIETRLRGLTLGELRGRENPWTRINLVPGDADALVRALSEVTRTRRVSVEEARALGLWDDEQPLDNPHQHPDGQVDVPSWRHAIINYPHPLLQQGLVVLDTPGLNAIGAEPELTLSLLPSAHAIVFVLGADTGVTRSDLAIWRDHLGARALERFVVLNKIDTLEDPLLERADVERQIEQQREDTARTLDVNAARVYPVSARDALAARLSGDPQALAASRIQALESALSNELLPRQRQLLAAAVRETLAALRGNAHRRIGERRRQNAEEILELRGLRGKSGAKLRTMLARVEAESTEFERCLARLQAMRLVHLKMLRETLQHLSSDLLRNEMRTMHHASNAQLLHLGMARAFAMLCKRLRDTLERARSMALEMKEMLEGSFHQLNADFAFSFLLAPLPDLARYGAELRHIEARYGKHLGITNVLRMSAPGAMEHFRRMLLSKLRVVFESAASELEMWSKAAESQVDVQLRERRRGFKRRTETLERIQSAADDLETRIVELEFQDNHWRDQLQKLDTLVAQATLATQMQPEDVPRRNAA